MILIGAQNLSKSYTTRPLFEGLNFSVENTDRIGLIGPNGAGKSTLLKILAGQVGPDSGKLSIQKGLTVGFLEQVPQFKAGATIESTVREAIKDEYDWNEIARAEEITSKLDLARFGGDTPIEKLSGGWKKRVALARELARAPSLLLLDEPTNHLDIESILWLEELLARAPFGTITITHDRLFLQRISNRIIELDRRHSGGLLSVNGDYATFLEIRDDAVNAQKVHETKLKNTLRRETEWLRRGAKARQTKQQARIQGAKELADKVEDLTERNTSRSVRLDFQSTERQPKKLIEAKLISKAYSGNTIIPPLDLIVTPKSRIGLMGQNGSGKSTLIRLLTKTEEPDSGTVLHAEKLRVSYFEQNRETLDPSKTVMKTVCPAGDHVDYAGTSVHVKSYLSRFLFAYDQMDLEVRKLSGGEQSRLLLARLMLREANLLVLDEPTNDLDMATLDVLADVLQEFNGAIILVTHDRYFLDRVTNKILTFGYDSKGRKEITSLVGLEQWEEWRRTQTFKPSGGDDGGAAQTAQAEAGGKKRKLSYKDQRELDLMESTIEKAETELARLTAESAKPEVSTNSKRLTELSKEMATVQAEIQRLYARWAELEGR
ncbi:MAG: ABC-F family ATP-binding cassette domain-containing protein [Bdellovibrionia bacterium]